MAANDLSLRTYISPPIITANTDLNISNTPCEYTQHIYRVFKNQVYEIQSPFRYLNWVANPCEHRAAKAFLFRYRRFKLASSWVLNKAGSYMGNAIYYVCAIYTDAFTEGKYTHSLSTRMHVSFISMCQGLSRWQRRGYITSSLRPSLTHTFVPEIKHYLLNT